MKIYQIHHTRNRAVIFAATPDEAVTQALERGLIGDWE